MMKNTFLIFIASVLLLPSCSTKFDGKDGVKTTYFPGTEIVQVVADYKDGKRVGELKEYYRSGQLKTKQFYKDDKLTDSAFFYHENGKLKEVQYVKDLKKEGSWKKYNKEGKLIEEINFENDYLEGASSKYTYRTGRLLQRMNFKGGMKEGKQEFYYNNGNPKAILYYHYNKPGKGTEEFLENGEKINNDFKITVRENNKLLLNGKLQYFIKLENPQPDDEVYLMADGDDDSYATTLNQLEKKGDEYVLEYNVSQGGFVMETAKIGAFRKTAMGNTVIQTKTITVSANNF